MTTTARRIPLRLLGEDHAFAVPASVGPGPLTDVLPAARALCDQATAVVLDRYREAGRPVSCRIGCFACCLHLVAVTLPEALALAAWVGALPEARRAAVRGRFAAALTRLEQAELLEADAPVGQRMLMVEEQASHKDAVHELSRRYFRLQLPCPFLEDDRCAAYEQRPMVCREHHVVSPAEHCAAPEKLLVQRVETRVEMTAAVAQVTGRLLNEPPRTIPLVLALEWAEANADRLAGVFDGEQLLGMLVEGMAPPPSLPRALVRRVKEDDAAVPLPPTLSEPEQTVTADIALNIAGRRLQARIAVPAGRTPLIQLLPVVRQLSAASLDAASEDAAAEGMHVSCKAGCGACCRQLVPLALPEARAIRDLVEALPEPRRSRVKERFAAARTRLGDAGLLAALEAPQAVGPGEPPLHGEAYFRARRRLPIPGGRVLLDLRGTAADLPRVCRGLPSGEAPPTPAGPEWPSWPRRCRCGGPSPAPPLRALTTMSSTCR